MDEFNLDDALDHDPASVPKLNAGATNPQPGHQGPWPGQPGHQGPWPGQPGNPGPWPGQPGNPGPWPGQPGNPGPWPGQPGNPGPWPGQPGNPGPWPVQPGHPGPTARALNVPYDFPLQGGWPPLKMLTVEATIKMNIDKFVIDVYSGQDIVLHFNVRFKEDGHNQAIVRNKRVRNVWGAEERSIPCFPFKKGENFKLLILGESNQYKVAVNAQHFIEFKHGLKNLNQVTKVNIYGDIILHKVAMM